MADDVTVDNGTLTDYVVAADGRTINSVAVSVERVDDIGNTTAAASQVTVTNSSTTILAARETRRSALILNLQTVDVFIDPSGGTAATTHFKLIPGAALPLPVTCAITGITAAAYTASGDAKVHVIETYDS